MMDALPKKLGKKIAQKEITCQLQQFLQRVRNFPQYRNYLNAIRVKERKYSKVQSFPDDD
jgi:hypothetical protein